jgi:hypothetical protein
MLLRRGVWASLLPGAVTLQGSRLSQPDRRSHGWAARGSCTPHVRASLHRRPSRRRAHKLLRVHGRHGRGVMNGAVMSSAVMSGRHGRGAILLVRVLERLAHELLHHLRRVLHQLRRLELREDAHRRQSHIRIRILEPVGKTGRRGEHLTCSEGTDEVNIPLDLHGRNQAQSSAIERNQAQSSAIERNQAQSPYLWTTMDA